MSNSNWDKMKQDVYDQVKHEVMKELRQQEAERIKAAKEEEESNPFLQKMAKYK